jgi:hypothetical protein
MPPGVTDRKIRYFSVFRPCNLSLSRPLAMVYSSDALKNRLEPEAGTPIFQDVLEWPVAGEKPIFRQLCQGLTQKEPRLPLGSTTA